MNQLKMIVMFVLLPWDLLVVVQCNHTKNLSYLNRVLNYSFAGFSCVELYSLNDLPREYYKVLPALGVPVIINESHKHCDGFVLFATNTVYLKKMLLTMKTYYNHRIVCYLLYKISKLDDLVKSNSYLFGESEALVTDGYHTFKLDQIEKQFYEIYLNGEEETWGEQIPIMNFKGREITVAGFNVSMFTEFGPIDEKGHPAWIKGIDLYVFLMLAPLMNVTWKVLIIEDKWGLKYPNGTWAAGIFKTVMDGQADIAMGSIWMSIDKYESLSLSTPTMYLNLQFLIRRPTASNAIWSSIFRHYPMSSWALLLVAVSINIIAIFSTTYCTNRIRNDIDYKRSSAMSTCSWMSFGMVSVDADRSDHKNPGPVRFLLCCWALTAFTFMINVGSSLISQLTTPELHHRPENIQGLVEGGYFWGLSYTPDFERILDLSNPWHMKWAKRFKLIKDKEEHIALISNDKFVLWGKTLEEKFFVMMEDFWKSDMLSGFEISSEKLATFYITFAMTPGSQLLPALNKYSGRIIESGHLGKRMKGELMMEGDPYMSEVLLKTKQDSVGYSTLTMSHFQGVFYILFIGLSMATILFFLEIIYYKNKISNYYLRCILIPLKKMIHRFVVI